MVAARLSRMYAFRQARVHKKPQNARSGIFPSVNRPDSWLSGVSVRSVKLDDRPTQTTNQHANRVGPRARLRMPSELRDPNSVSRVDSDDRGR
jgi:hypothetical protein